MRCPQGEGRISLCPLERTQKEGDRSMATNIRPVRVAVVGCGSISGIYLENITRRFQILAGEGNMKDAAIERNVLNEIIRSRLLEIFNLRCV